MPITDEYVETAFIDEYARLKQAGVDKLVATHRQTAVLDVPEGLYSGAFGPLTGGLTGRGTGDP